MTDERWEKAYNHTKSMREMAKELGANGIFYIITCNELISRYQDGERTEELLKEMENLQ